jgi:hypothetical protein
VALFFYIGGEGNKELSYSCSFQMSRFSRVPKLKSIRDKRMMQIKEINVATGNEVHKLTV